MNLGFTTRIALVLAVILGIGVAVTGLLSVHKFERTLADLLTSRFRFVANDISHRVESQMDLGIALPLLQDVTEDMDTFQRSDKQILSIEVYDEGGTVLFSTDPSFVGDLVSEGWIVAGRDGKGWSILERDAGVVGVPLSNNLNQKVGSLVLRYSRSFLDDSVTFQSNRLLLVCVLVVLGMSLFGIFGTMLLLRRPNNELKNLREAIDEVALRQTDGNALGRARSGHPEFFAFATTVLEAHDAIDKASDEIRQLDEEDSE